MAQRDRRLEGMAVGATVRDSHGMVVGSVERITEGIADGPQIMIARHGHAEYLLAVPLALIDAVSPDEVRLNVTFQSFEALLFEPGGDAGPTTPTESADQMLGHLEGASPMGPATG